MSGEIQSVRNRRVMRAVHLRSGRHRRKLGLTIIDGEREILQAVHAQVDILELFVGPAPRTSLLDESLLANMKQAGTQVFCVTDAVLERLAFGNRVRGVVAIARPRFWRLHELSLPQDPLVMVLERAEKPGNIGAIVRTADSAGANAVVVCDQATDLYNPNAIRASLGAIFAFPTVSATVAETLDWLTATGLTVFVAHVQGGTLYTDVDFLPGSAIVLGSEADGVSESWSAARATRIRLPMLGASDSLNVSNAAAVLAYEACRQRHAQSSHPKRS